MILIHNIYYMLAYAFQVLNEQGYKNLETESFGNCADLCSAILIKGFSIQIKRGLFKDYIEVSEATSSLKGKINVTDSVKSVSMLHNQMVCEYDEFSENSYLNQIIKTTFEELLKMDVSKERKKNIRKLLIYFKNVDGLDPHRINWKISFTKTNQSYRMLIGICNLVLKGLIQTNADGSTKMMGFFDEQRMCRLYEKFILEYFRKEHKELTANASQIPWQLDDDSAEFLPIMQTDITLNKGNTYLIIDAKYYEHTMQTKFDVPTLHSNNLYQIFTYVKNKETQLARVEHKVSGMLLYAKTDEEVVPNNRYRMSGNSIEVRTLDLNVPFADIRSQLDVIAQSL